MPIRMDLVEVQLQTIAIRPPVLLSQSCKWINFEVAIDGHLILLVAGDKSNSVIARLVADFGRRAD